MQDFAMWSSILASTVHQIDTLVPEAFFLLFSFQAERRNTLQYCTVIFIISHEGILAAQIFGAEVPPRYAIDWDEHDYSAK